MIALCLQGGVGSPSPSLTFGNRCAMYSRTKPALEPQICSEAPERKTSGSADNPAFANVNDVASHQIRQVIKREQRVASYNEIRGDQVQATFGQQIRNYVSLRAL